LAGTPFRAQYKWFFGSSGSALQTIWGTAIKKLRGTDLETKKLFRLKGGSQLITDAFAARLGERVRLGCPVIGLEHGETGVSVTCREFGEQRKRDADYMALQPPIKRRVYQKRHQAKARTADLVIGYNKSERVANPEAVPL
jgi:hypothetical protein